jgi:hypothetical protein
MTKKIRYTIYLAVAIYATWFVVFESINLPHKIDTHIHVFRVMNFIESFKNGILFPNWHDSPYWGYPEDYNFFLSYLFTSLLGLIFPIAISFKISFVLFYWSAAIACDWALGKIFNDRPKALLGSLLYVSSSSFINFGLGSGSLPRVAAFVFFPLMLGMFIEWWKGPTKINTLQAALIFFLSYLAHPIAALAGVFSILFIPFFFKSSGTLQENIKISWKWFLLGSLLFAWPVGHLTLAKGLSSWDEVYQYYAQFRLHFFLKSFFGFWLDNPERTKYFYMGSFPLIISIVGSLFLYRRKLLDRPTLFVLTLTCVGFLIILFGQDVVGRNTYRFDLIFNFGVSASAAIVLSQIKWRSVVSVLTLLIILDQTSFFRTFGGQDYVNEAMVEGIKSQHQNDFQSPRVLMDHINPNLVLTKKQFENLSMNQWIEYHGVLEVTPYNLGLIPFDRSIANRNSLFDFLGIPKFYQQKSLGSATSYSRFLYIEANTRKNSYGRVYAELLKDKMFDPYKMPLVFTQSETNSILIRDREHRLSIDPLHDPGWKNKVFEYYKGNQIEEIFPPFTSLPAGKLVVIKEASHPRREVYLNDERIDSLTVEPGLTALIVEKKQEQQKIEIHSKFLLIEKFLGSISLMALIAVIVMLKRRKMDNL